MKATDLILRQHREVEQLFDQLENIEDEDLKGLREELAKDLVAHSVIEKDIFYPAIKGSLKEEVTEALVEHGLIEYALSQVLSTRPQDESFQAKMTVLRGLVEKHLKEEEADILKRAETTLGPERLEQMGAQMEARFEQVRNKGYKSFLKQALVEAAPKMGARAPAKKAAAKATPQTKRTPSRRAPTRGAATGRSGMQQRGAPGGRQGAAQTRQTRSRGGRGGSRASSR